MSADPCAQLETSTVEPTTAPSRTPRITGSAGSTRSVTSTTKLAKGAGRTKRSSTPGLPSPAAPAADACCTPTLTLVSDMPATSAVPQWVTIGEALEMRRLYEDGYLSLKDIAKRTGRSVATVHRHLHRQGVQLRPRGPIMRSHPLRVPHDEMERTIGLYESGLSVTQAAEQLGLSYMGVMRRLRSAGVQIRSRSEAQRLRGPLPQHFRLQAGTDESKVLEMYIAGASLDDIVHVAKVARSTITKMVRRNGVPLRQPGRYRKPPTPPSASPVDLETLERVDSAPLAELLERHLSACDEGERNTICERMGFSPKLLYYWRMGERPMATVDQADAVLQELGLLWSDVYDD